ncbi:MAG: LptE family protein [Bdellovibrionota bacterium]
MKPTISGILLSFFLILNTLCLGCAYRFGSPERSLPGGVSSVALPQFTNKTMETGIEVYFTNALREEFQKSKRARVTNPEYADAIVEGTITGLTYTPGSKRTSDSAPFLPTGTVIAAEYNIVVEAELKLIQRETKKVLWSGIFSSETTYTSPQVTLSGLNTVNPLYNLSARRSNIQILARQVIVEAYNRMTENF